MSNLRQQFDTVGRLLEQQVGATSGAKPIVGDALTTLRRNHWQRGNLVGVDDPRFGNVRYTNDARGQIVRTNYELQNVFRTGHHRSHRKALPTTNWVISSLAM